jgi:hypothetical protein
MLTWIIENLSALVAATITSVIAEIIAFFILRKLNKEKSLLKEPFRIWIIGFFRGTVIALYFFLLIYFFTEKWAVSTATTIVVFAISTLVIIGYGFFPLRLSRAPNQAPSLSARTDLAVFKEVVYLAVLLASLTWALDRFMPYYISFDCPSEVTKEEIVDGLIVKPDWKVRVLVHSIAEDRLWVQKIPLVDQKGTWRVSCLFGGEGGGVFEILALASPDSLALEVGDQVRPDQIPKTVRLSKTLKVIKRSTN